MFRVSRSVAHKLFAVALGIAVGSVLRRALPSLAVTLAIFVGLRVTIANFLRPHYLAPITKMFPTVEQRRGCSHGAWVLSSGLVAPWNCSRPQHRTT